MSSNCPPHTVVDLSQVYGSGPFSSSSFGIQHRGYLYAGQTGTYEFYNILVDSADWLWIGQNPAYSGYEKTKAILSGTYDQDRPNPNNVTKSLVAGTYYPLRLLFGNDQQKADLTFNITAPNGDIIASQSGPNISGYDWIVGFSCDGVSAPDFKPWGEET